MSIDLVKFENDIVKKGAEACLPANLPDEWLKKLLLNYESVYSGEEKETLSAPLRAVMEIMFFKRQTNELNLSDKELMKLLGDYRLELAFEEVSRKTDIEVNPADLASIFTDRDIQLKRKLV